MILIVVVNVWLVVDVDVLGFRLWGSSEIVLLMVIILLSRVCCSVIGGIDWVVSVELFSVIDCVL